MASLIADAKAQRAVSEHLRASAAGLQLVARRRRREAGQRQSRCLLTWAHSRQIRARALPSPWSDLSWQAPGHVLDDVALAVPEDA